MTVHILIVEDESDFIDAIIRVLAELTKAPSVAVAKSRDAAFALLEANFFDLVVLDLKIPSVDGALDAKPVFGQAVFGRARTVTPGTPILVLTGSPAEDFIPDMWKQQQQVDVWGEGKAVGTVQFLKKYKFDEAPTVLSPMLGAVDALADVELDRGATELTTSDDRLLRIFTRLFGGTKCAVARLGGGLSGAKVVRLKVTDTFGARVHDAVAKLGSHEDVRSETRRFDGPISRLNPEATPRKLATQEFGGGASAGVFYGLADGFDRTAFEVAAHELAATAVRSVEAATKRWIEGVPQTRRAIRDIRRRLVTDEDYKIAVRAFPIPWAPAFEESEIQTRWVSGHGDLHGSNILVSKEGVAVLIDYGDVGDGPASLDPVTLELSLLFHPQRALGDVKWPSLDQASHWGDIRAYLNGCPVAKFVEECRGWATRVAAGNREIAGSAYAYLMRQLKYRDTDKALAIALLNGVKAFYDAT